MQGNSNSPILVINAGSSSVKFAVYDGTISGNDPALRFSGQIADIGANAVFSVKDTKGGDAVAIPADNVSCTDHGEAFDALFSWLTSQGLPLHRLTGIGHRVVHGGSRFDKPVVVGDEIVNRLTRLHDLAPHHMPHNVGAIRACRERAENVPQIACFDTAFHASQPDIEKRLPLPEEFWTRGLRRYGFHGLSYEHVVHALPHFVDGDMPRRLIVFHLGNGASACAIKDGEVRRHDDGVFRPSTD